MEPITTCPFRKSDSSSHHRRKERNNSLQKLINVPFENGNNEQCGRDKNCKVVESCPGNKQSRKYCYRGNSNRQSLSPDECVR